MSPAKYVGRRGFLLVLAFVFLSIQLLAQPNGTEPDYENDVVARVARITFIKGDVNVKRSDGQSWERASTNLPLTEGDIVTTGRDSRFEIQFDRHTYMWVAENSYLKLTTLRDNGVAVSLSEGTTTVKAYKFDKAQAYFEIDAPQTTVSLQKNGLYRIDAGNANSDFVRVTVGDGGLARIYSNDSGFSLRSGRSARINLTGDFAGDLETSEAANYADDWDSFVASRDSRIARLLRNENDDRYYNDDIYGADELSDYGEWINTAAYGRVWRPNKNSIGGYPNWSPYRYGRWVWVSPFGWTWVNDEPWGWATYHHGRWIHQDGDWCWTPYVNVGRASIWRPALVSIVYINNYVYWYPLGRNQRYYDYNRWHRDKKHDKRDRDDRDRDGRGFPRGGWDNRETARHVPLSGVNGTRADDFGRRRERGNRVDSDDVARRVLNSEPNFDREGERFKRRRESDVSVVIEPKRDQRRGRPGAAERRQDTPVEQEIRQTRVYQDRRPVERRRPEDNTGDRVSGGADLNRRSGGGNSNRQTGAVERPTFPRRNEGEPNQPVDGGTNRPRNERNTSSGLRGRTPDTVESNENRDGDSGNQGRERSRERQRNDSQIEQPSSGGVTRQERRSEPESNREQPRIERRVEPRNTERQEQPRIEESRPRSESRPEIRSAPRQEERREAPRVETPRPRNEQRVERTEQPRQERREEPRREEQQRETPRSEQPQSRPEPRPEPRQESRPEPRSEPRQERQERREEPSKPKNDPPKDSNKTERVQRKAEQKNEPRDN